MQKQQLIQLLQNIQSGQISIDDAMEKMRYLPFEDLGFAHLDHHRQIRRGFPETIFCPGKTDQQIVKIFEKMADTGANVLATRAKEHTYKVLMKNANVSKAVYNPDARTITLIQKPVTPSKTILPIITAGTADLPVALEAKVTAEIMGQKTEIICDVGVAGIHRIFPHIKRLQDANIIIVVAGMEGALASVVAGLVKCPLIAVPTSIGYGANFGGMSALLTMLNSCAAGITVVNIDNGFSAAVTATMINRKIEA